MSHTPPSADSDELRDTLEDLLYDKLSQQPRPNDYADDAGYDDAAGNYIQEFVDELEKIMAARDRRLERSVQDKVFMALIVTAEEVEALDPMDIERLRQAALGSTDKQADQPAEDGDVGH